MVIAVEGPLTLPVMDAMRLRGILPLILDTFDTYRGRLKHKEAINSPQYYLEGNVTCVQPVYHQEKHVKSHDWGHRSYFFYCYGNTSVVEERRVLMVELSCLE